MKILRINPVLALSLLLLALVLIPPSCAGSNQSKIATQKQGLMIQDKAEYNRNKSHFKGSKSYKNQKKRHKQYGR